MSQVTVCSGNSRRRRWSAQEKLPLVEAAFAPGAVVADVASEADLHPGRMYRWRQALVARDRDRVSGGLTLGGRVGVAHATGKCAFVLNPPLKGKVMAAELS